MGFFDPPETRRQKRGAKDAQRLREQAARDATIELGMLAKRHNFARTIREELYAAGDFDAGHALTSAMTEARDILDRANDFGDAFAMELEERGHPVTAAQFEALSSLELEGRRALLLLRDEARAHLGLLGGLTVAHQRSKVRPAEAHSTA